MFSELCFNFTAHMENPNSNSNNSLAIRDSIISPGAPAEHSLPVHFLLTASTHSTVPVFEKMSCRMRGRRVTIPDPRGRKSLWEAKGAEITREASVQDGKYDHTW